MHLSTRLPRSRGFTLIELMIVCAVVGILAAVAYPSYTRYVQRGHRAAAQAHLVDLAQRQQQFMADSRSYADTVAALNMTTPAEVARHYEIEIETGDGPPPEFTITASPVEGGAMAGDDALTIDNTGAKTGPW
ncbi:type IV pilin protein [Pseudoduganella sp. GCM10020061]|uniref:type IV pilin protein n=1 Tax=Pseudoduganella sp. GCM10020061 TaxID=3317345 RepID=UPI003643168B